MTSNSSAPASIPRQKKMRQTVSAEAPSTWTLSSASTATSPPTSSSESTLPPHSVLVSAQTGYKTPAPVSRLPSRSPAEIPVDLEDSDQDRDQDVRSQGLDDGAGDVHVLEEGPGEVHRHEDPAERQVRQRKSNLRYSADAYVFSSEKTVWFSMSGG